MDSSHISDDSIELYLLGQLPNDRKLAGVRLHVLTCESCAARVEKAQSAMQVARDTPHRRVPAAGQSNSCPERRALEESVIAAIEDALSSEGTGDDLIASLSQVDAVKKLEVHIAEHGCPDQGSRRIVKTQRRKTRHSPRVPWSTSSCEHRTR